MITSQYSPTVLAFARASEAVGLAFQPADLHLETISAAQGLPEEAALTLYAQDQGLEISYVETGRRAPHSVDLPAIVIGNEESWVILSNDGERFGLVHFTPTSSKRLEVELEEWGQFAGETLGNRRACTLKAKSDARSRQSAEYLPPKRRDWLYAIFIEHRSAMMEMGVASFFGGLLSISTSLFAMQVWDRVVPAQSTNTLWVLVTGTSIALLFTFGLQSARVLITDHMGKQADLLLSSRFFAHMLAVRNDARPRAPGSLMQQLRDLENIREMMTSTTLGALLDLPFLVIFLFIIWLLGGALVLVPLTAIPLVVIPGLLYQRRLAELSREGMAESSLRNSILMEAVHRVEDIKNLQAESGFRHRWNHVNDVSARIGLEQRHIMHNLTNWSQVIQQGAYIGVVTFGVFELFDQKLSFGAVLACSILTSRTIAPIGQVAMLLGRLQSARVGKEGLDQLLALPTDNDVADGRLRKNHIVGRYDIERVGFTYHPDLPPALTVEQLVIEPGERIGVIGKTGAGKSTLLRLLAGVSAAQSGSILLDGINILAYAPADLRRSVGPLLQDSSLFYGTLRENLKIGAPDASDEELLEALRAIGVDRILLNQPAGLELPLREGGIGLSGGQRQATMLARTLLRNPDILILDEPTASFDDNTEQEFLARFDRWLGKRTLIVSTHRFALTALVDRLVVVDRGRIVMDGPKERVVAALSAQPQASEKKATARSL